MSPREARFLIFRLLGPATGYLSVCLPTGWAARWADLPSAYGIEVVQFLLRALIDRWLEDVRSWERVIVAGIAGFMTSAVAVPVAAAALGRGNPGFMVLGFYAAIPAAAC